MAGLGERCGHGCARKGRLAGTQGGCPWCDSRPQVLSPWRGVARPSAFLCVADPLACRGRHLPRTARALCRRGLCRFRCRRLRAACGCRAACALATRRPVLSHSLADRLALCRRHVCAAPPPALAAVTTVAATAPRTPRPRSSGNARWIAAASKAISWSRCSAPLTAHWRNCALSNSAIIPS